VRRLLALALLAGCGGDRFFRPLEIEIDGLSARADTLVLKLFPAESGQTCTAVTMESARELSAPHEATWRRADGAERRFELPAIESDGITIIAYALMNDAPIQFLCRELSFAEIADLEDGRLILSLSRRAS